MEDVQLGLLLLGLATTIPFFAPDTLEPVDPILFKTPCIATGLSDVSHDDSAPVARGLFWTGEAKDEVREATKSINFEVSMIAGADSD